MFRNFSVILGLILVVSVAQSDSLDELIKKGPMEIINRVQALNKGLAQASGENADNLGYYYNRLRGHVHTALKGGLPPDAVGLKVLETFRRAGKLSFIGVGAAGASSLYSTNADAKPENPLIRSNDIDPDIYRIVGDEQ